LKKILLVFLTGVFAATLSLSADAVELTPAQEAAATSPGKAATLSTTDSTVVLTPEQEAAATSARKAAATSPRKAAVTSPGNPTPMKSSHKSKTNLTNDTNK